MEMNAKKALKNLGIEGVTVEHSTIDDVVPGAADLFICSADLLPNAEKAGKAIGLNNMVAVKEIQEKRRLCNLLGVTAGLFLTILIL